jgi:hypothetical protein
MHDPANGLLRIPLPRTPMNRLSNSAFMPPSLRESTPLPASPLRGKVVTVTLLTKTNPMVRRARIVTFRQTLFSQARRRWLGGSRRRWTR